MIFPPPPISTPFQDANQQISGPWIKWLQAVSVQLGTASTPVTGSTGGNAALQSLLAVLVSKGIIQDQTT